MQVPLSLVVILFLSPLLLAQGKEQSPEALLTRSRAVLAQLEGEIPLAGLKEAVEVRRDRWGIPHIHAKNTHDLFFAQGFVAAQDRLFQLDLWRRQARGELAEVFGLDLVEADRFARLVKYRGDMNAEWASYSPDTRSIATAFTQGINACIDRSGDRLPVEFQLLGVRPGKWQLEDILGRMSGIYMSRNFLSEIQRSRLVASVGIEKARWLAPVDPAREYEPALDAAELKAVDARILAGYNAAIKALTFRPARSESNNWVVAGERSVSGKPLLASDPHRATALPSLRYLVHLHAPGWNVIGSGEPALPGVALGHNEHIAWGFTIVGTDQADVFVEETNPRNADEYRVGERWEKMTVVREQIGIKGRKEKQALELRYTRHGPVLHQDAKRHRAYALKWVGSEPGGAAYLRALAVARASNRKGFLAALEGWKIPSLNFVYADVEGNTGWIAAARTPVRPRHDGLFPVPGWIDRFDWTSYLPLSDWPQSFNPKAGFVATSNQKILPEGYRHQIGYEFAPPYRFERVSRALAAKEKWELSEFRALQHDVVSLPGLALARLLRGLDVRDRKLEASVKLLVEWDGKLTVESRAGPLYAHWLRALQEGFHTPHVPKELRENLAGLSGLPVMLEALEKADPRWFGKEAKASRDELLRAALTKAAQQLEALSEAQRQRWGALHRVTFRHPLSAIDASFGTAFDLGPVERPGDVNTPNNTRHDSRFQQVHGATYRHLFDLADWDRGLATSAPGQSGQPGSPHYGDLLPLWSRGDYFSLAYSRKKVVEVTRHLLLLSPR